MRRYTFILLLMSVISISLFAQEAPEGDERPLLLVHFMPWYQTPDVTGFWGWHWTMEHFNPSKTDDNGRPEFASHYMPLTGLYDSSDPAVLEYQVLLMKLSGIDGVIVDWYGTANFRDYKMLHDATNALFEYTQKAGLQFAIAYEDQTVKHMVSEKFIEADDALMRGAEDMQYIDENWFTDASYVRYNDQPLLFVFGPQHFRNPDDWTAMFEGLQTSPALVTLDGHLDWFALSSFPWPPMHMAGGIELLPAALDAYLDLFYRNSRRKEIVVGSAFPAFHDIYKEAGVRSSYGYIDPRDGATLRETMDKALDANAHIIQLVTWNDYGEGTIIEPTEETGYQYLEIVQEYRGEFSGDGFTYTAEDLRLPLQLFELRIEFAGVAAVQAQLDEVFTLLISGDTEAAKTRLETLSAE